MVDISLSQSKNKEKTTKEKIQRFVDHCPVEYRKYTDIADIVDEWLFLLFKVHLKSAVGVCMEPHAQRLIKLCQSDPSEPKKARQVLEECRRVKRR